MVHIAGRITPAAEQAVGPVLDAVMSLVPGTLCKRDPIMSEGPGVAGGIGGAVGFIGMIVLLNVLSYVFNWGWVFY